MQYYEVDFKIVPCDEMHQDLLCAMLGVAGFETFQNTDDGVRAWIQRHIYNKENVDEVLASEFFGETETEYVVRNAPDEDWNSTWEQEGFTPITISLSPDTDGSGNPDVCIHDVKHTDLPECRYDILINPCQAFGTGSHETTRMILRQLCGIDLKNLEIVDAGTGTGILSIMCSMLGAKKIFAYDIDEWSVKNSISNLKLNNIDNVSVKLGDSSVLSGVSADLVIANINRNILLGDMPHFASCLNSGGRLLLSGFYREDVPMLERKAAEYGLVKTEEMHDGEWTMLLFNS